MLVTSCRDNICRVWAETIPPEVEGLANMSQFEGSDRHGHHGKHRHHNMHKHRFMQRLKHMKCVKYQSFILFIYILFIKWDVYFFVGLAFISVAMQNSNIKQVIQHQLYQLYHQHIQFMIFTIIIKGQAIIQECIFI